MSPTHGEQEKKSAYNLANFLRTQATPEPIRDWSLTSLKDKLIKIGAKVVSHGRYIVFQMAEVAIPRQMFQEIFDLSRNCGCCRCPVITSIRRYKSPSCLASSMAFVIAHLQRQAHARLYRRRTSRWRGGDLMPVTFKAPRLEYGLPEWRAAGHHRTGNA